jgi:hypothetical protein
MKQMVWMSLSAKSLKWCLVVALILAGLTGSFILFVFLRANPDPDFWFIAYLPIPSYAINVQNRDGGSLGGYRIIQFETDQSVDKIQQFYRTELLKRGWYHVCSPTKLEQLGCPLGLSPVVELADAYERDDEPSKVRQIDVSIFKPGENLTDSKNRLVEIVEYIVTHSNRK